MCEAPARRRREFLRPQRMLLVAASCASIVAGSFMTSHTIGLSLIGLGFFVLLTRGRSFPRSLRWSSPSPPVQKVVGAPRDREETLRRVFDQQRPDLELCAKLLCDDPATASELLLSMKRVPCDHHFGGATSEDHDMRRLYSNGAIDRHADPSGSAVLRGSAGAVNRRSGKYLVWLRSPVVRSDATRPTLALGWGSSRAAASVDAVQLRRASDRRTWDTVSYQYALCFDR